MRFQPKGYGTIVDQRDLHVRPEFARFDAGMDGSGALQQVVEEHTGIGWRGCRREPCSSAIGCIGSERELRYQQQPSTDVPEAAIHLPGSVGKDSIGEHPFEQPIGRLAVVTSLNADEREHTCADLTDYPLVDADLGP